MGLPEGLGLGVRVWAIECKHPGPLPPVGRPLDLPLGPGLMVVGPEPGVGDVKMTGCGLCRCPCSWRILLLAAPALVLL